LFGGVCVVASRQAGWGCILFLIFENRRKGSNQGLFLNYFGKLQWVMDGEEKR